MSTEQNFFIPRLTDLMLIDAFEHIAERYGKTSFSALAGVGIHLASLPSENSPEQTIAQWNLIKDSSAMLLSSMAMQIGNLQISFYRGTRGTPKSGIFDEMYFLYNGQGTEPNPLKRLEILSYLGKTLKSFDPGRAQDTLGVPEQSQLAALHESTLSRLELLGEDVIRKTNEARSNLEVDYANKRLELDLELKAHKTSLDAKHDEALREVRVREEELAEEKKKIDDRGNTHARRELRNRMLGDVKERIDQFGVSKKTEGKRAPVAATLTLALLILAILVCFSGYEINRVVDVAISQVAIANKSNILGDKIFYIMLARISFATIAFMGTAIYFVRWQNRWAEQHSNAEFQLQQFYIDVNRANWVIESGLEWKKETEVEMPDQILASVTKNLFKMADEPAQALHPADELASALLGSASKLKIKSGENEMEFNNPGKIGKEKEKQKEG